MNTVSVIGRLGRDPQINAAGSVASFSIAVQRQFKNKQTNEYETDWFNCKAFGKTAGVIQDRFSKGSIIAFNGHMQNNNYEKPDGTKVYRDEVIVDLITFIPQNNDDRDNSNQSRTNTHNNNSNRTGNANQSQNGSYDPFEGGGQPLDISDDDLPF